MRPVLESFFAGLIRKAMGSKGQTLVEYTLVLAVITVALVLAFSLLSSRLIVIFSAITSVLDTAQSSH
jgi:Flp pilus assembly pilin Flp